MTSKRIAIFLSVGLVGAIVSTLGVSLCGVSRLGPGLPQHTVSKAVPSVDASVVLDRIRNSGAQFQSAYFAKWSGDPDAYDAVEAYLSAGPDTSQNARKALDAVAAIAGANPALAANAFEKIKNFGLDDCEYSSKKCDSPVSAVLATAKMEVPAAMAILGHKARSVNNREILQRVISYLDQAKDPAYWQQSKWKSDGYLDDQTPEGLKDRNLRLAKESQEAADRLAATANSAVLARK